MQEETVKIKRQQCIAPGIYELYLSSGRLAGASAPGQFVSLYSEDSGRLLPRPISICGAEGDTVRLVYRVAGRGTEEFSGLCEGDTIRLIGPLGNGFPDSAGFAGKSTVLFGGGIGIPPMLFLAKALAEAGAVVTAVLGYRDRETFLAEEFSPFARVLIATEDGSIGTKGNVLDTFHAWGLTADVLFACGPLPMLHALREFSLENELPLYLSLEERMACGVGACLGCVTKTIDEDPHSHVKNARICKDGPVFLAAEIEL